MSIVERIASERYVDEKALYEANKAIENLPQANWNQNDATQPSYIENRTHWIEPVDFEWRGEPLFNSDTLENIPEGKIYLFECATTDKDFNVCTLSCSGSSWVVPVNKSKWSTFTPDSWVSFGPGAVSVLLDSGTLYLCSKSTGMSAMGVYAISDCGVVNYLPAAYIPSTIARTASVVTSVNGQTGAVTVDIPTFGALATKDTATKTDLESSVQASLDKADTALQSYTETDPTVPAWAKASTKPSYTASEVGLGNVDNVKQYSANNPPPYPVESVNGKTGEVTVNEVPSCSTSDNGKILGVVDGAVAWKATTIPDWNQNDATQPDYINNRTHYDLGNTSTSYTVKLSLSSGCYGIPSGMITGCLIGKVKVASTQIAPYSYDIGSFYGKSYTNLSIGEVVTHRNSGPEFNFCINATYVGGEWNLYFYADSSAMAGTTVTVSNVKTAYQLDKKYLPMADIVAAVKASYPSAEGVSF